MSANAVSVIVINRNCASSLQGCLSALREQTRGEIIVVDDASSDRSCAILESFSDINLIRLREPRGFVESVRRGYRAAHGDFVAVVRSDVLLGSNWLRSLSDFLETHPRAAACGGKNYLSVSAPFDIHAPSQGPVLVDPKDASAVALVGTRDELREVACLSDAAFLVRRQTVQALDEDFLDPCFLTGFALLDFLARAARLGWSCFYVPEAEAWLPANTAQQCALRGWIDSLARDRVLFCYRHFSDLALNIARSEWARKAAVAVATVPLRPWLNEPREKRANMVAFRWAASNRRRLLAQRQLSFDPDFDYHAQLARIQSQSIQLDNEYAEIVDVIPDYCKHIVDVGCGAGALGRLLKRTRKDVQVLGVESAGYQADRARRVLDSVHIAAVDDPIPTEWPTPDCVVFANTLEHLQDPWKTLRLWRERIGDSGCFVIRLPNAAHQSVLS
jgi:glycosyltransferase involved in cell wall biosynthesis